METLSGIIRQEQQRFTGYQTYEQLREHGWNLQEKYPDLARVKLVGYASDQSAEYPKGRPIEAVIISDSKKEGQRPYALMQTEHENELPPTLALQLIAEVVCKHPELLDDLGYNLILLNTTHPDGIALQSWAANGQEFTPLNYVLNFFRSCPREQVAWGYPFRYKNANFQTPTSEVRASMRVMQMYRPQVLHSAHAAAIDGVHFLLTHLDETLIQQLEGAAADNGLLMRHGEAESPYVMKVDRHPGFYYPVYKASSAYDYRAKRMPSNEMRWSSGTTSTEYLSGVLRSDGPFTLLSEVPYMTTEALADRNLVSITRREAAHTSIIHRRRILGRIAHYFTSLESLAIGHESPEIARLANSVKWYYADHAPAMFATEEKALLAPTFDSHATRAEAFTRIQGGKFGATLFFGEAHHLAVRLGQRGIAEDIRGEIEQTLDSINEASPLQPLDLPKLVGTQALSGLIALQ